jgi:DNA repair protein RadC
MTSAHNSVRDSAESSRPVDHLLATGASALTDAELLAILLGHTMRGGDHVATAARMLRDAGSLRDVMAAEPPVALAAAHIGPRRYALLQSALELTRRHYLQELATGPAMESPAATRAFLVAQLRDRPYEVFCLLYLDNRHRLIGFDELFRGTIDGASVHPREVVRQALRRNAAAVILAHNHPSGVAEPSQADELITLRLRDALALVDIRVLDHLIVGGSRCVSLAERGVL